MIWRRGAGYDFETVTRYTILFGNIDLLNALRGPIGLHTSVA